MAFSQENDGRSSPSQTNFFEFWEKELQKSLEDINVASLLGFAPASQNFDFGLPAKFRFQASAQDDSLF